MTPLGCIEQLSMPLSEKRGRSFTGIGEVENEWPVEQYAAAIAALAGHGTFIVLDGLRNFSDGQGRYTPGNPPIPNWELNLAYDGGKCVLSA